MLFRKIDARQYAALRIVFGFLTLASLLGLLPESTFYYSDRGWFPLRRAIEVVGPKEWSILHGITSPAGVKAFFALLILASLGMIVGFRSRLCTIACFVGVVSLQSRNWLNTYGGDAVLRLALFYLALAPTGLAWSVDSVIKRFRKALPEVVAGAPLQPFRRTDHGPRAEVWPLRLMQIQTCLIYLTSGLAKLHGTEWRTGSALGLVLLNPVFARWDFTFIETSALFKWVIKTATWTSMAWEISFPVLVLGRRTRWLALVIGLGVHLGTIVLLNIHWFGYLMIGTYLAFLPDSWFERAGALLKSWVRRYGRVPRIRVIYDDSCGFCRRSLLAVALLDVLRRIEFVPLQRPERWKQFAPQLQPARLTQAIHAVEGNSKKAVAGVDAFALIGKVVPALWPLSVAVRLPGLHALGARIYSRVAAGRTWAVLWR